MRMNKLLGFISFIFLSCSSAQNKPKQPVITEGSAGLHGYISFDSDQPPAGYGAGISFYSAVWPLVDKPLADFQIGLPSTWIIPENSDVDFPLCPQGTYARDNWAERGPTWGSVFQTVEGGLGYWAGNNFRYGPPKFSMNGTSSCYDFEIASPGWDFFYHNTPLADDKMGIAQLSNSMLVPPDGLTFEGNPDGLFLGYAWMALPFMEEKQGPPPTGENSWTLFLNADNFKGPVAYYVPETWSKISKGYPTDNKRGLDARDGEMGGGAMEINTVPRMDAKIAGDTVFYKIPKLQFPVDDHGRTILVQDVKYYSKQALFNSFKAWRNGINACTGAFDKSGSWEPDLSTEMPPFDQGGVKLTNIDQAFTTMIFSDNVFGIQWEKNDLTEPGIFPQYYRQVGDNNRVAVPVAEVPADLISKEFRLAPRGEPYTSPQTGVWANPGPASESYEVVLLDGSTVTYCWYRFVDQPSLQQFNWSRKDKEKLQALVEKVHAHWLIDQEYIEPLKTGGLVTLDPALMVKPPKGFEVGFVPIVTGQK